MGIEQLFDGSMDEPQPKTPVTEQPPAEVVEQPENQPEPQVEQPPEAPAAPPKEEQPQHVPLATFLDQRDEAKRWRQEAEQLRAQQAERNKPADAPDPFDDPQGYRAHMEKQFDQRMVDHRFQISDTIARQQHGAEAVDAAGAWAAERARENPGFAVAYMNQAHPIDWIVQQHKRDQLMQQIGDDPDAYVLRRYAEMNPAPNAAAPAVAQQQPAPTVPTPPRSLASAPGSGGGVKDVPVGPTASLEAVFQR